MGLSGLANRFGRPSSRMSKANGLNWMVLASHPRVPDLGRAPWPALIGADDETGAHRFAVRSRTRSIVADRCRRHDWTSSNGIADRA